MQFDTAFCKCFCFVASFAILLVATTSLRADVYGKMIYEFRTYQPGAYVKLKYDAGKDWILDDKNFTHVPKTNVDILTKVKFKPVLIGTVKTRTLMLKSVTSLNNKRVEIPDDFYTSPGMEVRIFQREGDFYGVSYDRVYPGSKINFAVGTLPMSVVDVAPGQIENSTEETVPPAPAQ